MDIHLLMQELISCPTIVQKDDLNICFFLFDMDFWEWNLSEHGGYNGILNAYSMGKNDDKPTDVVVSSIARSETSTETLRRVIPTREQSGID